MWRAATFRVLKWLSPTEKFWFYIGKYSNTNANNKSVSNDSLQGPRYKTFSEEQWSFCLIFLKFGGPVDGSTRVFGLLGDWILSTVHKKRSFIDTKIATISLIMPRFWWSFFFCFTQQNVSYQYMTKIPLRLIWNITLYPLAMLISCPWPGPGTHPPTNLNITTNKSVHLSGLLIMNRHLPLMYFPILLHSFWFKCSAW